MVRALHNPVHRVGGVTNIVKDDNELFPSCEGAT
jgi:hypothetical protein